MTEPTPEDIVRRASMMGLCSQTHHEHLMADAKKVRIATLDATRHPDDRLRAALEKMVVWLQAGHPHPGEDVCTARAWDELCGEAQDHERALLVEARAALASHPTPSGTPDRARWRNATPEEWDAARGALHGTPDRERLAFLRDATEDALALLRRGEAARARDVLDGALRNVPAGVHPAAPPDRERMATLKEMGWLKHTNGCSWEFRQEDGSKTCNCGLLDALAGVHPAAPSLEHTPWARAIFAEQRLWMACSCGWNAMGRDHGTWNEHAAGVHPAAPDDRPALCDGCGANVLSLRHFEGCPTRHAAPSLDVEALAWALRHVEDDRPGGAYPHLGPDDGIPAIAAVIAREYQRITGSSPDRLAPEASPGQ